MNGTLRGVTGKLIGIDGSDGIVKLDDTYEVKILDMVILAKLATNWYDGVIVRKFSWNCRLDGHCRSHGRFLVLLFFPEQKKAGCWDDMVVVCRYCFSFYTKNVFIIHTIWWPGTFQMPFHLPQCHLIQCSRYYCSPVVVNVNGGEMW